MSEEEFEQRLTLILLESLIAIKEIEQERRDKVERLFNEFLSGNEKKD